MGSEMCIRDRKIPRKLSDDVNILTHQYRQGNILNIKTAKNEINKLISAAKPKDVFYNTLKKYAITHPLVSKRQEQRHDKISRSIERVLKNIEMKRFKTVIVNFLLFKPVGDDHDFKATGERRYKHPDGSLWAQIGGDYQITIRVNESDMTRLYDFFKKKHTLGGGRDFRTGMGLFCLDDTFADYYNKIEQYTDAFRIIKLTPVENSKSNYNPLTAPLRDGTKSVSTVVMFILSLILRENILSTL